MSDAKEKDTDASEQQHGDGDNSQTKIDADKVVINEAPDDDKKDDE